MPQPHGGQTHVDGPLTRLSIAYMQNQDHFIAGKVFPVVPVDFLTDSYYVYNKEDWFRDEAAIRADSTESVGSGYNLSTASYSCDLYAFHKDVGAQILKNSDAPLNHLKAAAKFVARRLLLRQEKQFVSDALATSIWGKDYTGVASSPSTDEFIQWSAYSTSDPIQDVEAGKAQILSTTGYEANTLVLGYDTFRQLRHHPDVVDRVKYTSAENISAALLGNLFEVDRVLVSKSISNTAAEGATASYAFTAPKSAWLGFVNPAPALEEPSAGYTFAWNGVSGGLGEAVGVDQFDIPEKKTTRVEGEVAFDNKIVGADLGCFFTSAVA